MSASTDLSAGFPALIVVGVYRDTGGFDNLDTQDASSVPFDGDGSHLQHRRHRPIPSRHCQGYSYVFERFESFV